MQIKWVAIAMRTISHEAIGHVCAGSQQSLKLRT
jgi:hypothetical protein